VGRQVREDPHRGGGGGGGGRGEGVGGGETNKGNDI